MFQRQEGSFGNSMEKKKQKDSALFRTTEEYSGNATVHGVGYVFSGDTPAVDRFLWALLVLGFLSLATYLSVIMYTDWRANQVTTTLKRTTMPTNQIDFPAITICSQVKINKER